MTAHLLRSPTGAILGGAGTDINGAWSWWAHWTSGRRVQANSEAEALMAAPPRPRTAPLPTHQPYRSTEPS